MRTTSSKAERVTASTRSAATRSPATTSRKPMSEDSVGKRIDTLMKRQGSARSAGEVPVLTEVVNDERTPRRAMDGAALEALARELERAVLERLGPEVH